MKGVPVMSREPFTLLLLLAGSVVGVNDGAGKTSAQRGSMSPADTSGCGPLPHIWQGSMGGRGGDEWQSTALLAVGVEVLEAGSHMETHQ